MKHFMFLIIFICQGVLGQTKYGIVDINRLIDNHPLKYQYDSILMVNERLLDDSLSLLNIKLNKFIKDNFLPNDKIQTKLQIETIEKEMIEQHMAIKNFKDSMSIKLKNYRNEFERILLNSILKVIIEWNKDIGLELILDKKYVLFSKNEMDITDLILEKMVKKYPRYYLIDKK